MIKLFIFSPFHNDYLYINQQVQDIESQKVGFVKSISYKNDNDFVIIVSFKGSRKGYMINHLKKLIINESLFL